jgi:hypothetical protein
MRFNALALAAAGLIAFSASADDTKTATEKKKLQGVWLPFKAEVEGRALTNEEVKNLPKLRNPNRCSESGVVRSNWTRLGR